MAEQDKATSLSRRQRFALAVSHQEPDRIPIDLGATGGGMTVEAYNRLKEHLGLEGDEGTTITSLFIVDRYDERVLRAFDIDFRHLSMRGPRTSKAITYPDGSFQDEWGLLYKKAAYYMEMVNAPLHDASLAEIEAYPWPDGSDPGRVAGLAEEARRLHEETDYVVCTQSVGSIFQLACRLRGMDQYLMDMMIDKPLAKRLIGLCTETTLSFYDNLLSAVGPYVQLVETQDDLGMQTGPFISPALYREIVQPCHARLASFIKQKTGGQAKVFMHSDGSIFDLLPDIIEAGVDVINPTQPQPDKMEPERLKGAYGDRITFHAALDQQHTIPFGSVEEVRAEVRRKIRVLAPGGGYIFSPCHNLQPDVPVENMIAMYEAAHEYGKYPIG
jgi:uroporphyrinogen decarboxylase